MQFQQISAANPATTVVAESAQSHLNIPAVREELPPMSQVLVMGDPYFNQLAQRSTAQHVVTGGAADQI